MFYEIVYNLTERKLEVYLNRENVPDCFVRSKDGHSQVGFTVFRDDLPLVTYAEISNPNQVSLIQDWIEDAIENSLRELNVNYHERFEDNHWKDAMDEVSIRNP